MSRPPKTALLGLSVALVALHLKVKANAKKAFIAHLAHSS